MPATTPPATAPVLERFEAAAGRAVGDDEEDVEDEDELVLVAEPVLEGYPVLEAARQEVSAPSTIRNGADVIALTSVPIACSTYWPAVMLTFDQVHDNAVESTPVATMVLWPLDIAAFV